MGKNNIKFNNEQVDERLVTYGYKRLDAYVNNRTKMNCIQLNTGYKIVLRLDNLCSNPKIWGLGNEINFEYNINLFLKKNNSKCYYISHRVVNKKHKKLVLVTLKCHCGNDFQVILTNMVNGYYKAIECDECKNKKGKLGVRIGTKKRIEEIERCGYKILDKDNILKKTINANTYINVEDKFGFRGRVCPRSCNKINHFTIFSAKQNKEFYIYNINLFFENLGYKTRCIELIDSNNAKFICGCGNEYIISPKEALWKHRCDKCTKTMSKIEYLTKVYLEENNIEFIQQYKILECYDQVPLPFDFYLTEYNVLIEVDGIQHYEPGHFGTSLEDFEIVKKHDEIKTQYCLNNNIELIRIPYWEFDNNNYKKYLTKFIKD